MKKYKLSIPIGELFNFLSINNDLYETIQLADREVSIETTNGSYTVIHGFVKKQGHVREYQWDSGKIKCDEKHKVKQRDGKFSFINDTDHIIVNGEEKSITRSSTREYVDVYDIGIDPPHEYKTASGVYSHNTTLAKIIANNVDADVMYLNASDENNVETVREKVKNFASTVGFRRWKICILDECLEAGTLVTILRKGQEVKIPIEQLDEENDLVKSYDIETNNIEWQPFMLWNNGEHDIWEIELENGELVKCTDNHKWFVYDTDNNIKVVKTCELAEYGYILSPI